MNQNRLKTYTFRELSSLHDSLKERVKDLEIKIATIYFLGKRDDKLTSLMFSQITEYKEDISDVREQMLKIVKNEFKHK